MRFIIYESGRALPDYRVSELGQALRIVEQILTRGRDVRVVVFQ